MSKIADIYTNMTPEKPRNNTGRFEKEGNERLDPKPFCVKLPESLAEIIRAKPDKTDWLRQVIIDAAVRDGIWEDL